MFETFKFIFFPKIDCDFILKEFNLLEALELFITRENTYQNFFFLKGKAVFWIYNHYFSFINICLGWYFEFLV